MRIRKLQAAIMTLMVILGLTAFNINYVFAWYNTPVQTKTLYCQRGGGHAAKMGTTTQYGFIGPSVERSPQFYSALIAKGGDDECCYGFFYVRAVRIEVTGVDPNGSPLLGDSFGDLTVLLSPDDSGVEQEILKIVFDVLLAQLPYGLNEVVKNTVTSGGATTNRDAEKAWAEWTWSLGVPLLSCREKGLRFGYELNLDPTLEGTYTISIHYSAIIWWSDHGGGYEGTLDLYDTVYYEYVNTPNAPSRPSGPTTGYRDILYDYSTSTTDPNGDSLRYEFSWGDGTTYTTGWYTSGATASASHVWNLLGTYYVKVRAQDSTGAWSDWSPSLTVNVYGSVTLSISASTGGTTNPAPGTYTYESVCSVTVTAYSYSGYYLNYWILDGSTYHQNPITVTMNSDHTLKAYFKYGAGGDPEPCPTLFVWNGNEYIDYGVINIHNPTGEDVVREVSVLAEDVGINSYKARFRLQEGWPGLEFSESDIDQVKLYAVDGEGNRRLCPLIGAVHYEQGNVLLQLLISDDYKIKITLLEIIDLTFVVPYQNIQSFTFVIEGNNILKP